MNEIDLPCRGCGAGPGVPCCHECEMAEDARDDSRIATLTHRAEAAEAKVREYDSWVCWETNCGHMAKALDMIYSAEASNDAANDAAALWRERCNKAEQKADVLTAELRRLYVAVCRGQTRSDDARAIAQAVIDEYVQTAEQCDRNDTRAANVAGRVEDAGSGGVMTSTELRRLLSEGTALPWSNDGAGIEGGDYSEVVALETRGAAFMQYEVLKLSDADKALILGAVNALPHLLAVVEAAGRLVAAEESETCTMEDSTGAFLSMRDALRALEAGR